MAGDAMNKAILTCALPMLALLSACDMGGGNAASNNGAAQGDLAGARIGGPFTLTDQDGKQVRWDDFKGQYRLVYFGYTYCPDVCPMVLSHLKKGMLDLKEQAKDVQVLFISIDPERDTHEKLKDYLPYFYPTFVGLTGSVNDITKVAKQYGVGYFKQYVESVEGYFMAHIDAVFLVDQEGRYIGRYKTKWDMEKLITDIQLLLDSG